MAFMKTVDKTFDKTDPLRFTETGRKAENEKRAGAEATLVRLEGLAHLMDAAFLIPGINRRVGLDAVFGLVPGLGDLAGVCLSSYIVYEAKRLGAPRWLVTRMALNVAFDGAVGIVPLAGDLFDAAFKANLRNVRLLRTHLERNGGIRPTVIDGTAHRIDG